MLSSYTERSNTAETEKKSKSKSARVYTLACANYSHGDLKKKKVYACCPMRQSEKRECYAFKSARLKKQNVHGYDDQQSFFIKE